MIHIYRRLIRYTRPYLLQILAAILCAAGFAAMTALLMSLIKPTIDEMFIRGDRRMLFVIPFSIIGAMTLRGLFGYAQAYLTRYVGNRIVTDLRGRLYRHTLLLPVGFHQRQTTGALISHIVNDVSLLQGAVSSAAKDLVQQSFTLLALIALMFYLSWGLALVALFVLPLGYLPLSRLGRRLRRISRTGQEQMGDLTSILQQTLSGVRTVKAFGREEFESGRFDAANRIYFKNLMRGVHVTEMATPILETLASLAIAAVIGFGGYHVIVLGGSTPGTFLSFFATVWMMYPPLKGLSGVYSLLQQASAAADRVFATLDTLNEEQQEAGKEPFRSVRGEILFDRVSFHYRPAQRVLEEVRFHVKPGDLVAIVGSSGSGKSTLVNLIPRFFDPDSGRILLDGIDLRERSLSSLREQIGIVSQEVILFDDTVRANIAYGRREIPLSRVEEAAQAAYADIFINKMPEGFLTRIGEGGKTLSGGERQRIAIARAILKDPPILILDEATSALDSESEYVVRKALGNLMRNRTTFVIAHRLSTILHADRILLLDQGRIVEEGKHAELLHRNGLYRRLYEMQFSTPKVQEGVPGGLAAGAEPSGAQD